jgi:hypothetical protein
MNTQTQLLTRKAAAEYLGVKENTLAVWATTKRHPLPYIKVGFPICMPSLKATSINRGTYADL